ncbi:MAG: sugar phosphate isomerase/epimerase [bacterium]|nr:sugar phosphate isomerase/epimerase [bacterium]
MTDASPARVLFSTGSLYLLDVAYVFALAREAGYDGVEVMCDERWSTRDPAYLSDLAAAHDLPVLVLHTPFSAKIPGWGYAHDEINRIERTLELAETLNAESIVVHLPSKGTTRHLHLGALEVRLPILNGTSKVKTWIETQLSDVQRKTRVKIALENMPLREIGGVRVDHTWWNDVDTWSGVHDHLTMDTTHWGSKGIDPLAAYTAARSRIAHVHLSNYFQHEEHHLPHKGELKLGRLLEAMAADGFSGTVSLEVQPQHLEYKDPKAMRRNLRDAAQFMRTHLGQPAHASLTR